MGAAGALLRYLPSFNRQVYRTLRARRIERPGGSMPLDEMTRRNLELVESMRGGETSGHTARCS